MKVTTGVKAGPGNGYWVYYKDQAIWVKTRN